MRWDNLLFLHWPIEPAVMRAAVPSELEIDTFDGTAWIALVPFRMEDTRFRSAGFECDSQPMAMHSDSLSVRGWNLVSMDRVQEVRT